MTTGKKLRLLKIREAAEILGVNPETLRRWDKEGKLPAVKVSVRGDRRYKPEDIERFIEKNKNK
ncbi:helix-turn-helix domain-containing protein [Patescibacteria group bacterium]|nr:helix-turn-helix domain-containing protein [Patescibacteria group bacterium]